MLWPPRLLTWLIPDRHVQLAERVAGRSRLAVWNRVASRAGTLAAAEARGYVRARAIAIVQAETDRLIEQEGLSVAKMRERIVAAAMDDLIESLLVQFQQRRGAALMRQAA